MLIKILIYFLSNFRVQWNSWSKKLKISNLQNLREKDAWNPRFMYSSCMPVTYLEPSRTSTMKLFYENS